MQQFRYVMNSSIIAILLIWMSRNVDLSPVKNNGDDGGGSTVKDPKAQPTPALTASDSPPPPLPSSAAVVAVTAAPTAAPSGPTLAVKKTCRLPSEAGVCSQNIKRFYYSAHSRHCMEFVYGGCNGNENNFDNITECEDTCRGVLPCPYVAWVPGCTLKQNGEDADGCQTYEMTCEPVVSEKDKTSTPTSVESTTSSTTVAAAVTTTATIAPASTKDSMITISTVTNNQILTTVTAANLELSASNETITLLEAGNSTDFTNITTISG